MLTFISNEPPRHLERQTALYVCFEEPEDSTAICRPPSFHFAEGLQQTAGWHNYDDPHIAGQQVHATGRVQLQGRITKAGIFHTKR